MIHWSGHAKELEQLHQQSEAPKPPATIGGNFAGGTCDIAWGARDKPLIVRQGSSSISSRSDACVCPEERGIELIGLDEDEDCDGIDVANTDGLLMLPSGT